MPRRTRLYLPGNEPKFIPNAGLHKPDAIILDLEDSVPPAEKDAARILVRNALRSVDFYGAERCVRINQGRMGLEDLRAVVPQGPDLILIPKCEDPGAVQSAESEIRAILKRQKMNTQIVLLPIIESALGVVNAYAIASASPSVCGLAIGLEDYTADIGVERTAHGSESLFARTAIVVAARAAGGQAFDSVYTDVDDLDGLRDSTLEAKSLGFDGKGCIHPRQIPVVHSALAPTRQEVEKAQMIVMAADEARKIGTGVVALGTKMIDAPVVKRAERVLRLAELSDKEGGAE
jgi:citrate lyase subunit beta/citryl-CoA lyase